MNIQKIVWEDLYQTEISAPSRKVEKRPEIKP